VSPTTNVSPGTHHEASFAEQLTLQMNTMKLAGGNHSSKSSSLRVQNNLNQINSTDEEDKDDSMESESKLLKSKSIKKKIGGFSKSPKILPSMPPSQNADGDPFQMLEGGLSRDLLKDGNKKGKHQANLVRRRKDSLLSEKDRRKQEIGKCGAPIPPVVVPQPVISPSQQQNQQSL
jgi:hypothetical protein